MLNVHNAAVALPLLLESVFLCISKCMLKFVINFTYACCLVLPHIIMAFSSNHHCLHEFSRMAYVEEIARCFFLPEHYDPFFLIKSNISAPALHCDKFRVSSLVYVSYNPACNLNKPLFYYLRAFLFLYCNVRLFFLSHFIHLQPRFRSRLPQSAGLPHLPSPLQPPASQLSSIFQ